MAEQLEQLLAQIRAEFEQKKPDNVVDFVVQQLWKQPGRIPMNQLRPEYQALLEAAEGVMPMAYNPYSHFQVGAALLYADGSIITGANMENASYGDCICAERTALSTANNVGKRNFVAVACIGRMEGKSTDDLAVQTPKPEDELIVGPCGLCRQKLFEFAQVAHIDPDVVMCTPSKRQALVCKLSSLLPLGFGPRNLGVDVQRWAPPQPACH